MASRAFSRSVFSSAARSAFQSSRNSSFRGAARPRTSSSTNRSPLSSSRNDSAGPGWYQRRFVESTIALHNAVAGAKLISHLAVDSQSHSALSLGLQGYVNAPFHVLHVVRATVDIPDISLTL